MNTTLELNQILFPLVLELIFLIFFIFFIILTVGFVYELGQKVISFKLTQSE